MRKIVSIIITLILLSGCSGVVTVNSITKEKTVLSMKKIKDEMEKYKEDTSYIFYKIEDKPTKASIANFLFGDTAYMIGGKYITGPGYFTSERFFLYQYGKVTQRIYENKKAVWEMKYKVNGYKYRINNIEKFKFKLLDKESKKEIETETEELTAQNKYDAEISEIKYIDYRGEKIEFKSENMGRENISVNNGIKITVNSSEVYYVDMEKISSMGILKNGEEIGRIFFEIPEIEIDAHSAIIPKAEDGHGGVYIKKSVDEDLKEFLLKCTLMQLQHKMMRVAIKNEMET